MRNKLASAALMAVGLLISVPLAAHHGGAGFYGDQRMTMKGTVKEWLWSNPHCLLTVEVKGDDGKVVDWVAETQAPNTVYPLGYRKGSFKPGDQITITIAPVKSGAPNGRLISATLPDGTVMALEGGPGRGGAGR
jgi:Family of unknown function (DUF6152)